jgi:hypothetical protein
MPGGPAHPLFGFVAGMGIHIMVDSNLIESTICVSEFAKNLREREERERERERERGIWIKKKKIEKR